MTAELSQERGRLLPIMMFLVGSYCVVNYFYMGAFQFGELIQGLGFFLLVPPTYFYPSGHAFKAEMGNRHRALWAKWLSYIGVALVVAGVAVKWL